MGSHVVGNRAGRRAPRRVHAGRATAAALCAVGLTWAAAAPAAADPGTGAGTRLHNGQCNVQAGSSAAATVSVPARITAHADPHRGESWPGYGRADAIVLSQDDRWLYAAVLDGEPRSIVQIDTQLDSVVRYLSLANYVPVDLALSPDETRMFVTTQDRFPDLPSKNVLIDVPGWRILREFPRPHKVGQTRFDRDIVFHPNGKLIFVTHDVDLDVYLNRR